MAIAPTAPNPDRPDPGEPFNVFLQVLRGAVRPVVTLLVLGVASWLVLRVVTVPEWYQTMAVSLVSYWFGQRNK